MLNWKALQASHDDDDDDSPAAGGAGRLARAARRAQNAASGRGEGRTNGRSARGSGAAVGAGPRVRERQPSRRMLESTELSLDDSRRRSSRARDRLVYHDLPSDDDLYEVCALLL